MLSYISTNSIIVFLTTWPQSHTNDDIARRSLTSEEVSARGKEVGVQTHRGTTIIIVHHIAESTI